MSIGNPRPGAGLFSAAALGLFLAAFAPATLATAPDGGISVTPTAALADDGDRDDRDGRRASLEERFGVWGWGDDRNGAWNGPWGRGGDGWDDDDDGRFGGWDRGDDGRFADRDDEDDDDWDDDDDRDDDDDD